ncbi:MAG: hypothetical protein AABY64_12660, partial [Bdellovibrionota bacterium]
ADGIDESAPLRRRRGRRSVILGTRPFYRQQWLVDREQPDVLLIENIKQNFNKFVSRRTGYILVFCIR